MTYFLLRQLSLHLTFLLRWAGTKYFLSGSDKGNLFLFFQAIPCCVYLFIFCILLHNRCSNRNIRPSQQGYRGNASLSVLSLTSEPLQWAADDAKFVICPFRARSVTDDASRRYLVPHQFWDALDRHQTPLHRTRPIHTPSSTNYWQCQNYLCFDRSGK